jgi:hypothetical protein
MRVILGLQSGREKQPACHAGFGLKSTEIPGVFDSLLFVRAEKLVASPSSNAQFA